jgi:hypothetical protein
MQATNNDGSTVIHVAAAAGHEALIPILIQVGSPTLCL